jgi:LuxR family maltose regulon positive regulatory protein
MTVAKSRRAKRVRPLSISGLSGREREILELLTQGLSNKEIGGKLDLSPFTVKNHLARIFPKLRVRSRTAAVTAYLRA